MGIYKTPSPINEPVMDYRVGSWERDLLTAELKRQSETPITVAPYIDGEWIRKTSHLVATEIRCPHDKKRVLGKAYQADAELTQAAIRGAVSAQKSWGSMRWEDRAGVFLKAADLLAGRYRPIVNASTMLGQSKTVHQAEIDAACELIDFFRFNVYFYQQIMQDQPISSPGMWNRSEVRGLEGFVFAVTPFNFSSIALNLAAAPALMGCAVVWKPAQTALLSAYWMMELMIEAGLPEGVIQLVPGDAQTVASECLSSPDLAGVHFTGSTAIFNQIWATVGQNVAKMKTYPRLVGETGGKDFVFAAPDCDEEALVVALVRGAFEYQGQKCSAASRAYIPRSIWPRVSRRLVELTQSLKMGDVEDYNNFLGAVIDEKAFNRISSAITRAQQSSRAKVIAGGEFDASKGYFIRPTVIETSDPEYETMKDELFGPVLTVYTYDDQALEQTLRLVDSSTPYALTGAVFARRREEIARITEALKYAAGNFYINDKPTGAVVGQQPFGGSRASGTNDKAGSRLNLERWMSMRTIKETFSPPRDYRYPYMN